MKMTDDELHAAHQERMRGPELSAIEQQMLEQREAQRAEETADNQHKIGQLRAHENTGRPIRPRIVQPALPPLPLDLVTPVPQPVPQKQPKQAKKKKPA